MEWEAALYLDHGEICLPAECLYKCFIEGARNTKNGKQFEAGVRVATSSVPLTYSGKQIKVEGNTFPNPNLNEVFEEHFNKKGCLQMVTVGTAKTPRCRPVFENWSCEVTLNYNENVIAEDTILTALNDAGMLKGLCDRRPLYGTFEVQVVS